MSQPDTFVVARVGRPHGLRGEVPVQVHTDDPEGRFVPGVAFATDPDGVGPLELATVRVHQEIYLLGFVGHTDRNAAEALRGTRLLAADDEEPEEDDAWREEDLVGMSAVLTDGTNVGEVVALHVREVQDLLEVRAADGRAVLVPFVEELVPEIDEDSRRVVLNPPPGLLELGELE